MTRKTLAAKAGLAPGPWKLTTVDFGMTGCDNCGAVIRATFDDLPGDEHYARKTRRPLYTLPESSDPLDKLRVTYQVERRCLACPPKSVGA